MPSAHKAVGSTSVPIDNEDFLAIPHSCQQLNLQADSEKSPHACLEDNGAALYRAAESVANDAETNDAHTYDFSVQHKFAGAVLLIAQMELIRNVASVCAPRCRGQFGSASGSPFSASRIRGRRLGTAYSRFHSGRYSVW
jgi:hypothetical protein